MTLAIVILSVSCIAGEAPAAPRLARPNIIFILTDDQGFGDVSANGNPVLRTPNIDRLHDEGVRFTDFHVSPTCAPTRSALMTGRHEFRNGVTHTILERERLTLQATTLAQVLRSAGYSTGIFGKWHLGDEDAYQPDRRGFEEVYIHGAGGIGQTYPGSCGDAPGNKYSDPVLWHNGRFEKTNGYCTDLFFARATTWIDLQRRARKPFFAYIATNAPHDPYVARPEDAALFAGRVPSEPVANFFGMVHNIDENIGRLLARLDDWDIAKNTLVVFMNDNGGTAGTRVFNAGMRGGKGTAWIGGTRASSFWRWTGTLKPGDSGVLSAHIDFFPTIAEIAGAKLTGDLAKQVEGRSLVPLLEDPAGTLPDRVLFTHLGRWPKFADPNEYKFRMCSVRNTGWHLVSEAGRREAKWQLFDMRDDYGEQRDVAAENGQVVRELAAAYDRWWESILPMLVNEKAVGPAINPFQERFYRQFGGRPTPEDLRKMNPSRQLT